MGTDYGRAIEWVGRQVELGLYPDAVIGIGTSAGIEVIEAFGSTSGATAVGDHFALFSVTKPLVGLATARALERGQLDLTMPLAEVLPGFGKYRPDTVTLQHLLTHTSGIVEHSLAPEQSLRDELMGADWLFHAGAISQYSSLAFEGIGAFLEAATGRPFRELVAEICSEAGGSGLTWDRVPHRPLPNVQEFLDYPKFMKHSHAGAGMFGRASDLLNVGANLLNVAAGREGIIAPSTLESMTTARTTGLVRVNPYPPEAGQEWGLTWNLRHRAPALLERNLFGHSGMSGAEWWIYPKLDLVFVLLTNVVASSLRGVRIDELHNIVVAEHGSR